MNTIYIIIALLLFAFMTTVSGILSIDAVTTIVFLIFGAWIWFVLNKK